MKQAFFWILPTALLAVPAVAQLNQAELVRPSGAADLNTHLARLATNPRDVNALIGAGEAALALDDPRAAAGFFARADAISSGNGRIKAGLGRVMLAMQSPAEALRLFDHATRLGYPDASFLTDRALARDMTGDQANAQRDYQAALKTHPDDAELTRRYAASLGISGQVDAAERILQPLLYKSDRAAWRYRVFILAMNDKQAEARKIADQTMPAPLVAGLLPYMQRMPYLTAAQKAAAVHFGHFPTNVGTRIAAVTPTAPAAGGVVAAPPLAQAIPPEAGPARRVGERRGQALRRAGDRASRRRDETRLASAASTTQQTAPAPVAVAPVPAVPVRPLPEPSRATEVVQALPNVPAAPAPQPPMIVAQAPAMVQPLPSRATEVVQPLPPRATVEPGPVAVAQPSAPVQPAPPPAIEMVQSAPAGRGEVQGPPAPGFETAVPMVAAPARPAPPAPPPAPVEPPTNAAPAQASMPQPDPQATRSLADIIRAIDVPEAEKAATVAAVDLAEVEKLQAARRAERQAVADKKKAAAAETAKQAAAKAKAEADAKAKAEAREKARLAANPSRNWVQIATGANRAALGFTLKGLRQKYATIAPQDAWVASWGRTNRLVIGPFASFTRARAVEAELKGKGADVFAWQSNAGDEVERFSGN